MTNYERIKAMSVDEMAKFLSNKMDCFVCPAYESHSCKGVINNTQVNCIVHLKQWLKSEVKK